MPQLFRLRRIPAASRGFAILLSLATLFVSGQMPNAVRKFPLTDVTGLIPKNVAVKAVQYGGRKAVMVTSTRGKDGRPVGDGFAVLPGADFQDGVIEADIAAKLTPPPGVLAHPGFVGIAFRARPDASHYELFYVRPGNSRSDDQAKRNHSVQYSEKPDFGWYKLRPEWPSVYESYAALRLETWIHLKIEVTGRSARLFLNGSDEPSLIVSGLKGEDLRGAVALWGYPDEEAYFSNIRITQTSPKPVKNGSDATGTWQVKLPGDTDAASGSMKLARDGNKLTGTFSGNMGKDLPIQGLWRDGYVDMTFPITLPNSSQVTAHLAGWIDGASAEGRIASTAAAPDGVWTATR
jgi:hypothetical protein